MVLGIGLEFSFKCVIFQAFMANIYENAQMKLSHVYIYHYLVTCKHVFAILSASVNIFVYCSFSGKYRLLLKFFLCRSCCFSKTDRDIWLIVQNHDS